MRSNLSRGQQTSSGIELRWPRLALLFLALGLCSACSGPADCDEEQGYRCPGDDDDDDDDSSDAPVDFRFWSPAFEDGAMLPAEFECGEANPELSWEGVPEGTVALAMLFDDTSFGNYPHWAIYNLPAESTGLAAGISGYPGTNNDLPAGSSELVNGGGWTGYFGSCPCSASPNTYRWRLWALDSELAGPGIGSASAQFADLASAADGASIEMLEMTHQYGPHTGCR